MGDITNWNVEDLRTAGVKALKAGRKAEAKFYLSAAAFRLGIEDYRTLTADELATVTWQR